MKYDPDTISKKIKKNEEIKNIFFVLIYIISVPIILFSIFLMLIELGKNNDVPEFLNFEFYTVVSDSMMPKLKKNDVIIVKKNVKLENIKEGNIITFKNKYGEIITHRVSQIRKTGNYISFTTKGDSNEKEDSEPVDSKMIIGRVVYTLPSYLLVFKNKAFFSAMVFVLIIIIMLNTKASKKKMNRKRDRERYENKAIWE